MAKSLTIKNKNNLILYPKTVSSLVYDNITGNTVKQDLDSLIGQVAELLGVENAFFGGIVGASTDIATDYTNNGYSGPYLYMVGTDMSSLVIYQYSGSGSPTQLFSGTTYDFTDYTEVKQVVAALDEELYGRKVYNTYTAGKYIIHTSGNLGTNSAYAYTDYIPVPASAEVRAVYKFQGASGIASLAHYNSSKTFITSYTANGYPDERTVTLGSTSAYIRVNLNANNIEECAVYVNGELTWFHTGRVPGGLVERTEDITGVDEVPTKNSINVIQSGGVYDEFDSLKKNVEQTHTVHFRLIDMQKYYNDQSSRYINLTNNRWQDSAQSKAFLMPIKPNTKYIIHGSVTGTSRYALLTDNDQTLNATPHYATGEKLNQLAIGTDREFISPADAYYMSVNWTLSSASVVPKSIEEAYSVTECIDEVIKQNHDIILYDLALRYMVDARIDSSTFGEVIFCLTSSNGNTDWGCSQLIDLLGATRVRYYTSVASNASNFYDVTGTVYYDKDRNPMQDGVRLILKGDAKYTWVDEVVPTGARYMRVSCRWSWNKDVNHYVRLYKIDADDIYGLVDKVNESDEKIIFKNARYGISEAATSTAVTTDITDGTISFLHFSDIHSDKGAAKAIRAFYDKYASYITDMLSTGDVVYFDHDDDFTFYTDNNLTDALFALGNHDGHKAGNWNSLGEQATYEKYFAPYISGWNVTQPIDAALNYLMYYYKDYTPANVRLIVIDGQHQTAEQLQWFTDTLAEAKTLSYTVVVASHYVPSTFAEEDIVKKLDGDMVTFHNRASSSLSSIDTRFKLSTTYADAVEAFIAEGGKFAIWLCGHYHSDYFAYASTHPNILFCAINLAGYERGGTSGSRSIGDHCANLVTIHPRSSLIKIVRVGLNMDRYLRPINVLTYQYNSRKVFTNY